MGSFIDERMILENTLNNKQIQLHFLLYTKIGEDTVQKSLGLPEYSYYFVYKGFKDVFASLGTVTSVHSEYEIIDTYDRLASQNKDCTVVFFCPPHVAPDIHPRKAFCVLAWEFDTIPNEIWNDDPRNDWRHVFNRHLGLICLSSHTRDVVQKAMGPDFPVLHAPVPVWEQFSSKTLPEGKERGLDPLTLDVAGIVIDNWSYRITPEWFQIEKDDNLAFLPSWNGNKIELVFTDEHVDSELLGGFFQAESWGTWSRLANPWIFLECLVHGDFNLSLTLRGFGPSIGKTLTIDIGGVKRHLVLQEASTTYTLRFEDVPPSHLIQISGIDTTPHGFTQDPRTMAVGIESLTFSGRNNGETTPGRTEKLIRIDLSGVIYTTVFNPADARKRWEDIVSAFCYALRDNGEATLILKITHHDSKSIMGRLHFLMEKIGAVKCRVIAIHGFLPDENFLKLIHATTYYVNASSGEGLCLPLMEHMACGIPAIAPKHTAMADYVDEKSSFLLSFSRELDIWPHDMREKKRAISFRVNWVSLVEQFRRSFDCAKNDDAAYRKKASCSKEKLRSFCSGKRVREKVNSFLQDTNRP